MALKEYGRKRDFTKTPEPGAGASEPADGRLFVVHKHAARRPHYDLRLQLGGALKSWALPRGPSFDPREKRLAVHVEDHPLEYAAFEGVIPEGQYGAGAVMVWDRGRWEALAEAARDYEAGELKFRLGGERMRGRWMLIRTGPRRKKPEDKEQWLLFKERDAEANPGLSADAFLTSVATGRTMAQIQAGAPAVGPAAGAAAGVEAAKIGGARRAAMPAAISPQLATPTAEPPEGPDWLHEVKFDGYRLLAFVEGGRVRLVTRRGNDWTGALASLAGVIGERVRVDAVVDGEAVILDQRGISDFQALQNAIHSRRSGAIVFFAFDVPWCNGYDLTRARLEERKSLLVELIGARQEGRVRLSQHVQGDGVEAFRRVAAHGLEGIVSKRIGSPYAQKRTADWRKVKVFNQLEFVIGGFSPPEGTRQEFGALLLGYYDDAGKLVYAGRVGSGFSTETLRSLGAMLRTRAQTKRPFAAVPAADAKGATWTRPDLIAEVQYRDWTGDGHIRHPSFRGIREDRDPLSVRREAESAAALPVRAKPAARAKTRAAPPKDSVVLSHPDRVVFPDRGAGYSVTKRQLAEYYEAVAGRMLPHIVGRPLTLVRCPDGEGGQTFFQKHPAAGMPAAIRSRTIKVGGETERCIAVDDVAGLIGLVQLNTLEVHPWGSRLDRPERPDRLVFDLDPAPEVPWKEVVEAAVLLRQALSQIAMTGFVRLTGGKGLHVVVPIHRRYSWDQVGTFCRAAADAFAGQAPRRFVTVAAKARRTGRIYIDYLRNARGATAIGPYSTRARPGALVALPVSWDELADGLTPAAANVVSVPRRLASGAADPWAGLSESAAALPKRA